MIIVQLQGGLSNQMFQYAIGRYLAFKRNTVLKLDLSFLEQKPDNPSYTLRGYALGHFDIIENFATPDDLSDVCNKRPFVADRMISKITRREIPYYRHSIVMEQSYGFDKNVLRVPNDCLLVGYWQSEKYFSKIEKTIRHEFSLKEKWSEYGLEIKRLINTSEAVSVHFRRGDYVNNMNANQYHGVCSIDYYSKALEYIVEKVKNPVFFFFSDDMEWVKENIKWNFPMYYIDKNQEKAYEDLQLMNNCKHHIIANSSFSWWGAWLNKSKEKIVIAPSKWFEKPNINTRDLLPAQWIRL